MSQEPLGHLVEMEPKENWAAREKTGTQGPRGADGKKGAKGEPGIQGSAGQKGQRGDKGDSLTPRLASHTNWKECAWKKADGKDSGLIYVSERYHCVTRKKNTVKFLKTKNSSI